MKRIDATIRPFTVRSGDGTLLQAFEVGQGEHRLLLSPGMGTPLLCWKYLFETLEKDYRVVTWDPRGCYGSEIPADSERIDVSDHVADGRAVLGSLGWEDERFALAGWSMGVEISLELRALYPKQAVALLLINGAFEHVLSTVTLLPFGPASEWLFDSMLALGYRYGSLTNTLVRGLLSSDLIVEFLSHAGVVAANGDFFGEVLRDFRELDFGFYSKMIRHLNRHSARALTSGVDVPTLITAGGMDKMTPLATAHELQDLIAGSELFVVDEGTHYTTIEFPDAINAEIARFLATFDWRGKLAPGRGPSRVRRMAGGGRGRQALH